MYHPYVQLVDTAALQVHQLNSNLSRKLFLIAGEIQHELYSVSPFKSGRRFFDAQWCWALGHIGLLYQAVRWFKFVSPQAELILETQGRIANIYFLNALKPLITIVEHLPQNMREEAQSNAVYFGAPKDHIHDFAKFVEKEKPEHYLKLSAADKKQVDNLLSLLGIKRPYIAVQSRHMDYDPQRNVTVEQVEEAISQYPGYDVVLTGLDNHPISEKYPSVKSLPEPHLASYLLSADCDQFIGSDSGAWTIPWAYQRPVFLINDKTAAWIYE